MKIMFSVIALSLLMILSISLKAQNEEILARLKEFKIDEERLSSNIKEEDAVHAYKLTSLTGSKNGNVESVAQYNPLEKIGRRWTLLTINGAAPSKNDIKQFNKLHNPKDKHISGKIDPSTYEIERDDKKFLIIKFRYIKETLPAKFRFLGDCDARVYCRKDIMEMSYAEFTNFRPTKVKMFNVEELLVEMYYIYDEESKSYIHEEARLDMSALLFGLKQEVEIVNYYSKYKVVK
jgi:hypothetical protein